MSKSVCKTYKRDRVQWIQRLIKRRIALGMSRRELGRLANFPHTSITNWENFKYIPQPFKLCRLQRVLLKCERGELEYKVTPFVKVFKGCRTFGNETLSYEKVLELKALRKAKGYSRAAVSKMIGLCHSYWGMIELGKSPLQVKIYEMVSKVLRQAPAKSLKGMRASEFATKEEVAELRLLRIKCGATQAECGAVVGILPHTWARKEKGRAPLSRWQYEKVRAMLYNHPAR